MSIVSSELKFYKAQSIVNGDANGGKMSNTTTTSGVKNNVFPDISNSERLTGLTRYRKLFAKVNNDDDIALLNPKIHFTSYAPSEAYVEFFEGTQTDNQIDITGSEQSYGCAPLASDVSVGDTTLTVTLENSLQSPFPSTNLCIYITDGTNEEYLYDATSEQDGTSVVITLADESSLLNDYDADETSVSAVLYLEDESLEETFEDLVINSTSGTYDDTTYPLVGDSVGGVEETFTLTFSSDTVFTCAGASAGDLGSGNITSDFSPTNSDLSKPYFTIQSDGWGGTWISGDTLEISTHPAAIPIWVKQTIPAGCTSYSGDNFTLRFIGETE